MCNKILIYRKTINFSNPRIFAPGISVLSPALANAILSPQKGRTIKKSVRPAVCTNEQSANNPIICPVLSLNRGVFYILKIFAYCRIQGMRSIHKPTSIFKPSNHPTINCIKTLHNSKNLFDNHFDTSYNFPLTNTINKLSVNFKIPHFSKIPIPITSFRPSPTIN